MGRAREAVDHKRIPGVASRAAVAILTSDQPQEQGGC